MYGWFLVLFLTDGTREYVPGDFRDEKACRAAGYILEGWSLRNDVLFFQCLSRKEEPR